MCDTTLADAGVLPCVRLDDHEPHRGCTYQSTSGVADAVKEEL